ncbi:GSCOCT00013094001.2-RA-CDS [Cotesia congregata]|uniref:Cc_serrich.7_32.10b n=1 Tax=Cotesia congregata TaxID=51543 RepID=S6CVR8_COTCN|nr:GSCOCT00013094001.2-RA-CDS [Cotesia congregata]CAG5092530.1 cc_serrich.7_32.10b [Cotesia congregata]CCQ71252.1 hypothetical protein SER-RICH7 [Cotesia congregata]
MADRKISRCRLEKSKEASGNVVSRFFRRLSPTKSYRGNETPGSSSSSTIQASRSRKKDSSAVKNSSGKEDQHSKKLTKSILNQPEFISSSNSSLSQPTLPWISPALSYHSLNQDKQATELKLLSQLHSNFEETTNILGNDISRLDHK